ncbi:MULTISPECIES: DUF3883 domain-containing protein [Phyllobacteriaceae]|jgi:hypothetical protein|nr:MULTISPECIES: DUF3883 domain-containing protein [Mesorhizobium]MDQ0331405.1 hypothetical protein [Mesorhizobium sp. YL-MeA3-2017]
MDNGGAEIGQLACPTISDQWNADAAPDVLDQVQIVTLHSSSALDQSRHDLAAPLSSALLASVAGLCLVPLVPEWLRASYMPNRVSLTSMGPTTARRDRADDCYRALGRASEERNLTHERASLPTAGQTDLAERIHWVSHVDGNGACYDILNFDTDGSDRLVEVKTTNGWERAPFHVTHSELAVAEDRRSDSRLVRLWNFAREPRVLELRLPLEAHVSLTAASYQASLL